MVAGSTNASPTIISASSPTQAVEEKGIFNKHFITIIIAPAQGPMANPPSSAGKSENCISKNSGNINGSGNFTNIYNM